LGDFGWVQHSADCLNLLRVVLEYDHWHNGRGTTPPTLNFSLLEVFFSENFLREFSNSENLDHGLSKSRCIRVHVEVQFVYADRCAVFVNFRLLFYT